MLSIEPPESHFELMTLAMACESFSSEEDSEGVLRKVKQTNGPEWLATDLSVYYDKRCRCATWESTLEDILSSDHIQKLQNVFANCIIDQRVPFGRPVLIWSRHRQSAEFIRTVLKSLVGEHNCSSISIQDLQKSYFIPFLDGKLVNFTHDSGQLVYNEALHAACKGESLTATRRNGSLFDFRPSIVWFISCDILPNRQLESFCIIQPTRDLTAKEAKAKTARVLRSELRGVLNWAIDYAEKNLTEPSLN